LKIQKTPHDPPSAGENMNKLDQKNTGDIIALTPMQEGMLFHYLKDPGSEYYFEQLSLEIESEIDVELFEKAWNFVIENNEMLRTIFRWEKLENPIQVVLKEHKLQPRYYLLTGNDAAEKKKKLEEVKVNDKNHRFDLKEVPFRVTLCNLEKARYVMIISNHHILYDGWSSGIILREFFDAYLTLSKGKDLEKPIKTKFKEFIHWMQTRDIKRQERFWKEYLRGLDTTAKLSIKKKTGEDKQRSHYSQYQLILAKDTKEKLDQFTRTFKTTPAAFFYGAWWMLLQKYNDSEDGVFGTTVSGRSANIKGIEHIVGLFINTLPLRIQSKVHEKISDLLNHIDKILIIRKEYESISLADIKRYNQVPMEEELFDSIMVIENYPLDYRLVEGGEDSRVPIRSYSIFERTNYDLTLTIRLFHDIEISLIYNPGAFERNTIIRLSRHFLRVLEDILQEPGKEWGRINLLSPLEKKKILHQFNDTGIEYRRDLAVHRLLEDRADRTPDNIALIGMKPGSETGEHHVSYHQLNEQADRLAWRLREEKINRGTIVALATGRSIEMMMGLMAVLKAGGTYLPLDPEIPQNRIKYMIEDSRASLVLTDTESINRLPYLSSLRAIKIDSNEPAACAAPPLPLLPSPPSTAAAYVIYTSGSTGKPKGVVIPHRAIGNFIKGITALIDFKERERILSLTTVSFDIFVLETLLPLTTGGVVVIGSPEEQFNATAAADALVKRKINIFQVTPSRLQLFLENNEFANALRVLNYLLVGGEIFPQALLFKVREKTPARIFNLYGPTETTVWSTLKEVTGNNLPDIGKPIANTYIYILSKTNALQPILVPGELCIAGEGVGRGYLNKPELTNQKFLQGGPGGALFSKSAPPGRRGQTLYRTGDMARWLEDGNIEIIGRFDHQVKIRGYRVEPEEIEGLLLKHESIDEAAVVVKEEETGDKYLHAYIKPGSGTIDDERLRKYLAGKLPAYMVPTYFEQLEKMPLTPAGKIDRKTLAKTGNFKPSPGTVTPAAVHLAPKSDMEKQVAQIWQKVLKRDMVGMDDRFFDLGGTSLHLVRVHGQLSGINKNIPMTALFKYPTIRSLSAYLCRGNTPGNRNEFKETKGFTTSDRVDTDGKARDIAVIGMAGRFPGAGSIREFWENLVNGVESISFFSDRELEETGLDRDLLSDAHYVKAKGVLPHSWDFDAFFFDYTPAEAGIMDPQIRIFHECSWEALENAGYSPDNYDGLIGVYAGAANNILWVAPRIDSAYKLSERFEIMNLNTQSFSTLVSYKLNLKGPSVTVQTACSTSLAAIDAACRALVGGQCHMALAGGAAITFPVKSGYLFQEGMIMSRDGHCRAFDAAASGTVDGNGAGVVLLKRLPEALADGDFVYAKIIASAINNDGTEKAGYTAPGIEGQVRVIRQAHRLAGIDAGSIGYIETHGTGTALGDPVEIESLNLAFNTSKPKSCGIGSIKTNIGHLDAAAGVAGFIKTILALHHQIIPPSINYHTPNPGIDFPDTPFYVVNRLTPWQRQGTPLRAGVSSFGIGGTNVHVILEEFPLSSGEIPGQGRGGSPAPPLKSRDYQLLVLSAKTASALEQMTGNLAGYFKTNPGIPLAHAAYTLQAGRKAFKHRRMLVCPGSREAVELLSSRDPAKLKTFYCDKKYEHIVFMFPGLGAEYVDMGRELYQKEPVFKEEMDHCFEILKSLTGCDIKEILYPALNSNNRSDRSYRSNKSNPSYIPGVNLAEFTQPVIFTFEYALARLLIKWGIEPRAMIGYSLGEYTAACLAGVFSLEDALKLVVNRQELTRSLPAGAMLSVPLPVEETQPLIAAASGDLSIAIDNGPSCIAAGPLASISKLEKHLKEKKYISMRVNNAHALHSPVMEPILKEFAKKLQEVTLKKPVIPYISNVSGEWITDRQALDPAYWVRHLRETVRFSRGMHRLIKGEPAIFIEVGPGRDLTALVSRYPGMNEPAGQGHLAVNLVRPQQQEIPDTAYLLERIGRLWLYGIDIHRAGYDAGEKKKRIPLPSYPFERQTYGEAVTVKTPYTGKKKELAHWFYMPSWERSPLTRPPAGKNEVTGSDCCLVFIDDQGLGTGITGKLRESGRDLVIIKTGKQFEKVNDGLYTLNPNHKDDYEVLFKQLGAAGKAITKVLHLWSISSRGVSAASGSGGNDNTGTEPGSAAREQALYSGFLSLIYLAMRWGKQYPGQALDVLVISNFLQQVSGDEPTMPGKALILGAVQVIPQEYPGILCRNIDVSLPTPGTWQEKQLVNQLTAELDAPAGTLVAYRGNYRWEKTYLPVPLHPGEEIKPVLKQEGIYWIIGGTGNIGLAVAKYLAKKVKARLILTYRSQPPAAGELKELEQMGAKTAVFQADVTDETQVKETIREIEQQWGSLDGLVYAVGVSGAAAIQPIDTFTESHFNLHLQTKVHGLMVLERALRDRPLDFCMFISSLSPILGGLGLASYSAAHHFMDAFVCRHNHYHPVKWTLVNMEGWLQEKDEETRENPSIGTGLRQYLVTAGEAPGLLDRLFSRGDLNQVIVSTGHLQTRINQWIKKDFPAGDTFPGQQNKPGPAVPSPRINLSASYIPPTNPLEQKLAEIWQGFFGIQPIGIEDDFFELGGDSLKAMTMGSRIQKAFNIGLPVVEFINRPTIKQLAEFLGNEKPTGLAPGITIPMAEKKEYYPLSSAQKRLYIEQKMEVDSILYNIPVISTVEGELDRDKLEIAFKKLIRRHESLRTSFDVAAGETIQRILEPRQALFEIEYYDLQAADALTGIISSFVRPFELSQAPLLRAALVQEAANKHYLVIDMHHIISDGISMNIFLREFLALYSGMAPPALPYRYKDYSQWQNKKTRIDSRNPQEEYWLKILAGKAPLFKLPTDYERPVVQNFAGDMVRFAIDAPLTGQLKKIAAKTGTTLYMLLLAVYNVLLSLYAKSGDILVGSPAAGRTSSEFHDIIGMFANMLVLRNFPAKEKTFHTLLIEIKQQVIEAFQNQDYPFEELVNKLGLAGDAAGNPLIDTVFTLQEVDSFKPGTPGPGTREIPIPSTLTIAPSIYNLKKAKFDLTLDAVEKNDGIDMWFIYAVDLFEKSTIEKLRQYYLEIIDQVKENLHIRLADISISGDLQAAASEVLQKDAGDFGFD